MGRDVIRKQSRPLKYAGSIRTAGNLYFSRELEKDVEWLGMLDKDYSNYSFYSLVKVQENGKWLMKYEEAFGKDEVRIRSFSEEYMVITDKRDAYMGFEYIKATLQRLYE